MLAMADAVILSTGWMRRLIAFGAGAFGALALAPLNAGPALIVPMCVAVWLLDGAAEKGPSGILQCWRSLGLAFGAGWWLGFGYFVAGLWWLGAAFLIDPEFTWALPLGIIGVPALLAVFPAFGFVVARVIWIPGAGRVLALALGLGLSEWARGHLLTGFPWNPFGMGLGAYLFTAQPAAIVGLDGLNLITIALFAAPATLIDRPDRGLFWRPTFVALGILIVLSIYGSARLFQTVATSRQATIVRILQPGLRPDEKFKVENKEQIVSRYIDMSKREDEKKKIRLEDVTMLVWPESAFPFILTRDPQMLGRIGAFLPPHTTLVTGAARQEDVPNPRSTGESSVYYNSIEVVARGGKIVDLYDKIHLVPFGEFLPFASLLSQFGLRHFVDVPGGFEPGTIRHLLDIPGMPPASPLVCYEAIFPGEVQATLGSRQARAHFLLNVTNDGWFGHTAGPSQHLAQARLRTVEEGLPMVRGAATGISAIIDPYGRLLGTLPLGAEGILDGALPPPIAPTIFASFGERSFWALYVLCVLAFCASAVSLRIRR